MWLAHIKFLLDSAGLDLTAEGLQGTKEGPGRENTLVHKTLKRLSMAQLSLCLMFPTPTRSGIYSSQTVHESQTQTGPPACRPLLKWTFTPFRTPFTTDLLWEESLPSARPPQPNKLLLLNTEYSIGPLAVTSVLLTLLSTHGLRAHTHYAREAQLAFGALPHLLEA